MEGLTKLEIEKIEVYKQTENQDIALYFFNLFRDDVVDIVFNKIQVKFSSIPFEKEDIYHILWGAVKKALKEYNKKNNLVAYVINNCYLATLREVRKYLSNGEIILNICSSFDSDGGINLNTMNKNAITVISRPRNILIDDLIETVCQCIKKYKIETIKRVIYFKSLGYTSDEIAKIISLKKYIVDEIISMAKRIAESKSF